MKDVRFSEFDRYVEIVTIRDTEYKLRCALDELQDLHWRNLMFTHMLRLCRMKRIAGVKSGRAMISSEEILSYQDGNPEYLANTRSNEHVFYI